MGGAAFLLAACLPIAEARSSGRSGPPLSQPWQDWRRLLRKRPVTNESSTVALPLIPGLCLVLTAIAALLVPSFTLGMATAPFSDLLVILGHTGNDTHPLRLGRHRRRHWRGRRGGGADHARGRAV